jgi:hypothetical protein
MFEFLRRLWLEGRLVEARVRAAMESAVQRGLITQAQADEILVLERQA